MTVAESKEKPVEKLSFIEKMKAKWKLDNAFQVVMVLLTFTLTGSTVVYIRKWLFAWLSYTEQTPFWIKTITYLVFVFPAYQILILVYGTLLGQFKFFWEKEKKLFQFILNKFYSYGKK